MKRWAFLTLFLAACSVPMMGCNSSEPVANEYDDEAAAMDKGYEDDMKGFSSEDMK